MKQVITVVLDLEKGMKPVGSRPYPMVELHMNNEKYNALRHFFEDIGYSVELISTSNTVDYLTTTEPFVGAEARKE
jgi:hypothetical protein